MNKPIRIPHSVVRKPSKRATVLHRYWQLGDDRQRATGLHLADLPAYEALGVDNFNAQRKALAYYDLYRARMTAPAEDRLGGYPEGSLGAVYTLWKRTEDWSDKGERTRDEYEESWRKHIEPEFGRTLITKITIADLEALHRKLRKTVSASESYRTLKNWRALLHMLEKKHLLPKAPVGAVSNPQPQGRGEFWLAREIARLVRAAKLMKRPTMGLLIRLAWETALSPVDCRTLSLSMLKRDGEGWYVHRARTKTWVEAKPPITDQLAEDIMAYAADLKRRYPYLELLPTAPLFRNGDRRAWSKSYLTEQFQDVRRVAFGKTERRQFLDIRRSANLEAALAAPAPATAPPCWRTRWTRTRPSMGFTPRSPSPAPDGLWTPASWAANFWPRSWEGRRNEVAL